MHMNTENISEENGFEAVSGRESTVDINTDENVAGTNNLSQTLDKYLRLLAEFENYKRRSARERVELSQTAGKEIIISLLDVLDDCDRAEKQLQEDKSNKDLSGVLLVFNKLRNVMQNRGLKPMESLHSEFDVEKHEAISEVPAPSADLRGKVVAEVMKGYYLNDKIIRFAKVIVGK